MDVDEQPPTIVSPTASEEIHLLDTDEEEDNITVVIRQTRVQGQNMPHLANQLQPRTNDTSLTSDMLLPLASGPQKVGPNKGITGAIKKTRGRPRHQKLAAKGNGPSAPGAQSTPVHTKRGRDSGETPPSSEQPTRKKSLQPSVAQYIKPSRMTGNEQGADASVLATIGTTIAEHTDNTNNSVAAAMKPTDTPSVAIASALANVSTDASSVAPADVPTIVTQDMAPPVEPTMVTQSTLATKANATVPMETTSEQDQASTSQGAGKSYAERVANRDLVMAIVDRRQPDSITALTPERYTALLRLLSDLTNSMVAKVTHPPAILDNRLAGGAMRLKCFDIHSRHWLERMVPKIDAKHLWNGAKLEVMEFAKIPKPFKVIGWFPGSYLTRSTKARNILQLLERSNQGIHTDGWTILGKDCKDAGTSMVLNIDESAFNALKARSFKLFGGVGGLATFKVPSNGVPKGDGGLSSPPEERNASVQAAVEAGLPGPPVSNTQKTTPHEATVNNVPTPAPDSGHAVVLNEQSGTSALQNNRRAGRRRQRPKRDVQPRANGPNVDPNRNWRTQHARYRPSQQGQQGRRTTGPEFFGRRFNRPTGPAQQRLEALQRSAQSVADVIDSLPPPHQP